jgi:cellulose synthase/poly-beta-1,6-N-acetylglucosamine synthase-like glycosyltransferase
LSGLLPQRFAVIVPAHNEQDVLAACLTAIGVAAQALGNVAGLNPSVRVVVVLDSCTDATGPIARAAGAETVTVGAHSVGVARAAGADFVLQDSRFRPEQVWLCNTDADSTVPANWLTHLLTLAGQGAELVLGTAVPEPTTGNHAILSRWHRLHTLIDGHSYVHGANLAIRADSYRALGGWSPVETGEDVDLAMRAAQASVRIARSAAAPVRTSSRLLGRAPAGYAGFLKALDTGAPAGTRQPSAALLQ